jgi:SAM-dependent methyltransferase
MSLPCPFFQRVLTDLLADGSISRDDSILVVCGGDTDFDNLQAAGFTKVTISNLDERMLTDGGARYQPYQWRYENAETLTVADGSYDLVLVHSGLHHLRCPLKGVTEMYRVARKGVIGFEPNLNLFTKLGARLGFGQRWEHAAVYFNDCRWGGVENSEIPNFVYRFRADDLRQTANTCNPVADHQCRFWYSTRFPDRLLSVRNPLIRIPSKLGAPLMELAGRTLPVFANNMAFWIRKPVLPDELLPWLEWADGEVKINPQALQQIYGK